MEKSFTLIEVIIAIFVITIGVLGAFSVTQQIISYTSFSASRLTAAYLAQEGIEIVRNIRDTNWLQGTSWTNCLSDGDRQGDYKTTCLTNNYDGGDFLNIDTNGYYSYSSGSQTRFKRKITITSQGSDILETAIKVEWEEKGKTYSITAMEKLYNWRD